ncbi:MAG: hypothetical protein GY696_33135 [Gammaproteobacteria bacterium]|nr:hypothetical protein [Gammaproteobacteria bacterium]
MISRLSPLLSSTTSLFLGNCKIKTAVLLIFISTLCSMASSIQDQYPSGTPRPTKNSKNGWPSLGIQEKETPPGSSLTSNHRSERQAEHIKNYLSAERKQEPAKMGLKDRRPHDGTLHDDRFSSGIQAKETLPGSSLRNDARHEGTTEISRTASPATGSQYNPSRVSRKHEHMIHSPPRVSAECL